MGFTVMQSFMDSLSVKSEPGVGTTVTMTKRTGEESMQMNKNDFSDNDALLVSAAQGDLNARNTLVTNNMGLVYSVVKRFGGRGFETRVFDSDRCDRSDSRRRKSRYELWRKVFDIRDTHDNRRDKTLYT